MNAINYKCLFFGLVIIGFVQNIAFADVCMPSDADFDEITCTDNGGTVGTPLGLGGGPSAPQGVPVDAGASLLLIAGAGYGFRKMRIKKTDK